MVVYTLNTLGGIDLAVTDANKPHGMSASVAKKRLDKSASVAKNLCSGLYLATEAFESFVLVKSSDRLGHKGKTLGRSTSSDI